MDNPFDDEEVRKIATLKKAAATDAISRETQKEQVQKKGELASRGLSQSGPMVQVMLDINVKRLRAFVYAHYNAWKDAISEAGYTLTSNHLQRIATEAVRPLEHAQKTLIESLKSQCHGLDNIVDHMERQVEQEVYSIRARFNQDSGIDISKAKVAERPKSGNMKRDHSQVQTQDFEFIHDTELRRIVQRDYAELQILDPDSCAKSLLIISGSVIEGILLDAIVSRKVPTKEKTEDMFLKDLASVASRQKVIHQDRLVDALRNYRNLIHPAREIRDKLRFSSADATAARAIVDVIINEVREYCSKNPPPETI